MAKSVILLRETDHARFSSQADRGSISCSPRRTIAPPQPDAGSVGGTHRLRSANARRGYLQESCRANRREGTGRRKVVSRSAKALRGQDGQGRKANVVYRGRGSFSERAPRGGGH